MTDIQPVLALPANTLGDLRPIEVLYEFDGPCIFTAQAPFGALLLAYLMEEPPEGLRYLVTTTTPTTINALKSGQTSVREALLAGALWAVDLDHQGTIIRVETTSSRSLAEDALPEPQTLLWSHLEPALSVRLEGSEIRPGHMPAVVLAQGAQIATRLLKTLLERASARFGALGRAPEWLRALYHLPIQRLAYGSLQLDLREPELQTELALEDQRLTRQQIVDQSWDQLREALHWATGLNAEVPGTADQDRLGLLEALQTIVPPGQGPVESVTVSGRRVGGEPIRLGREVGAKVRSRLTELRRKADVRVEVFAGRIRELDLDRMTFILRPGEHRFGMEDEAFFDSVREAYIHALPVRLVGRSTNEKDWTLVELDFVPETANED